MAPTRSSAQSMTDKSVICCSPIKAIDNGAITTFQRVQTPARDRSACQRQLTSAVRDRSLYPSPVAAANPVAACLAPPLSRSRLTPARWQAKKLVSQSRARNGVGRAVAAATMLQPICNHQAIEIIALFRRLQRLRACASRMTHVCVCARTCVYVRGQNTATLQPSHYLYRNQIDSGCRTVAARLQPQPVAGHGARSRQPGRFGHILGGRYRRAPGSPLDWSMDLAASTVMQARADETFGVFLGGRAVDLGADRAARAEVGQAGRNGGIPPFSRLASGRVGRPMLEGMVQALGIASFSRVAREPVRLEQDAPRGSIRRAAPPMPPFAPAPLPSMLAPESCRVLVDLRPAQSRNGSDAEKVAQNWDRWNGSGCERLLETRQRAAGLGALGGVLAGKLRRICDASGRSKHVN